MGVVRGIGGKKIVHVDRVSVPGSAELEIGDPLKKSILFEKGLPVHDAHILFIRNPDVRVLVRLDFNHRQPPSPRVHHLLRL